MNTDRLFNAFLLPVAGYQQGLHLVVNLEFSINILNVFFYGLRTKFQLNRNFFLLQAIGAKLQDLSFSSSQRAFVEGSVGCYNKCHGYDVCTNVRISTARKIPQRGYIRGFIGQKEGLCLSGVSFFGIESTEG
jgi:hypothetical protein